MIAILEKYQKIKFNHEQTYIIKDIFVEFKIL